MFEWGASSRFDMHQNEEMSPSGVKFFVWQHKVPLIPLEFIWESYITFQIYNVLHTLLKVRNRFAVSMYTK